MKKKNSPVQLNEYFFTKLNVEYLNRNTKNKTNNVSINFDYEVGINKDHKELFFLDFKVRIKPKKDESGIKIDANIEGYFSFPLNTNNDDMQYLVRINGCSILYGLLRGQVAMITGTFPEGKINLPTIVFRDEIINIEKRKKKKKRKKTKK